MSRVFERLPELVNDDVDLVRRGRFLTVTFLIASGATQHLVRVVDGRIAAVERGPFLMRDWRFAIRATEDAWRKFWEPVPAAGYHDVFAMAKFGHAVIEGDLLVLMQNLRYVQDLLAAPRKQLLDAPHGRACPHRNCGAQRATLALCVLIAPQIVKAGWIFGGAGGRV